MLLGIWNYSSAPRCYFQFFSLLHYYCKSVHDILNKCIHLKYVITVHGIDNYMGRFWNFLQQFLSTENQSDSWGQISLCDKGCVPRNVCTMQWLCQYAKTYLDAPINNITQFLLLRLFHYSKVKSNILISWLHLAYLVNFN